MHLLIDQRRATNTLIFILIFFLLLFRVFFILFVVFVLLLSSRLPTTSPLLLWQQINSHQSSKTLSAESLSTTGSSGESVLFRCTALLVRYAELPNLHPRNTVRSVFSLTLLLGCQVKVKHPSKPPRFLGILWFNTTHLTFPRSESWTESVNFSFSPGVYIVSAEA